MVIRKIYNDNNHNINNAYSDQCRYDLSKSRDNDNNGVMGLVETLNDNDNEALYYGIW